MLNYLTGRTLVAVVLLFITNLSSAQDKPLDLILTLKDGGEKHIKQAEVSVYSSAGYLIGGGYGMLEGMHVTDAVIPPAGVQLKPTFIPWSELLLIEFLEDSSQGFDCYQKAQLKLTDGTQRDAHVWKPDKDDTWTCLAPDFLKVSGKLLIDERPYDVEIERETIKAITVNRGQRGPGSINGGDA